MNNELVAWATSGFCEKITPAARGRAGCICVMRDKRCKVYVVLVRVLIDQVGELRKGILQRLPLPWSKQCAVVLYGKLDYT